MKQGAAAVLSPAMHSPLAQAPEELLQMFRPPGTKHLTLLEILPA